MRIFGWLATILFAMCFWPQLIRSYRRKSVGDISVWSWVLQTIGYACAVCYGFWLKEGPLMWGYSHGFLCSIVFLCMYFKYRKN